MRLPGRRTRRPAPCPVRLYSVEVWDRQGRLAESRSYLQFAYAQLQDPELAAHLGEVMWKQGERESAQALWADALEKSPGNAPLTETMARFTR